MSGFFPTFQCFPRYELMKKCWEQEQENRPSFHDIHEQLKEMLGETDRVRKLLIIMIFKKPRIPLFFLANWHVKCIKKTANNLLITMDEF